MGKRKALEGQLTLSHSPIMERWQAASVEIQQAPDQTEKAYLARQLVQCNLPHRNPGNAPVWRRVNGNLTLIIQPFVDDENQSQFPYGVLPRLVLFWVCTEAVKTKSRRLTLGKSFAAFMRELGLNPSNGGKRSDSVRLRDQINRLINSRIALQETQSHDGGKGVRTAFMEISSDNELWWTPGKVEQDSLFESWLELGEKFYAAIIAGPVPIDLRALRGLRNSALGLDLYSLIAYKTYSANRNGAAQKIPWEGLHQQMGAEYKEMRQFRAKVRALLPKIKAVYPQMKVTAEAEHLVVAPAPTAIASRSRKPMFLRTL